MPAGAVAPAPAPPGAPSVPNTPADAVAKVPTPSTHWVVHGKVFNLVDLKAIPGATVLLRDPSAETSVSVRTDSLGAFSIRVPKIESGGYVIAITRRGYRREYIEDSEPSLLTMGKAGRLEMLHLTEESRVLHVPLLPTLDEDSVSANFFLIPGKLL